MEKNFKAGDAVRLKTGGPVMTIDYKTKDGKHVCKWHDINGLQEDSFAPKLLEPASRTVRTR